MSGRGTPFPDDLDPYEAPETPLGPRSGARATSHSGFGIASSVLALLTGIGEFALIVIAGVMESTTPGGIKEDSPAAIVVGLLLLGGLMVALLGAVLGIVGLLQPGRRRAFALLGLIGNGLILLGVAAIITIGLMIG